MSDEPVQNEEVVTLPEGADPELASLRGPDRANKVRELYDNGDGMKRGDIAKLFGVPYQTIYQATKPPEGERRGRGKIILDNGEPRADYIRRRAEEGATRGEIAKELDVSYQVVFAATKGMDVTPGRTASPKATETASGNEAPETGSEELQLDDDGDLSLED